MSKKKFQTEVKQILDLVVHSLYSNREVFLRELISNASDALDKLKYLALTEDSLKSLTFEPEIEVQLSEDGKELRVIDNGIGMDEEDLQANLGTIASSGTKNFLKQMGENQGSESNLIGQFGVGFYSAFMVADQVEVLTKRAGGEQAFLWSSDGSSDGYQIEPSQRDSFGTTVILHLNESGADFANRWRLQEIIEKYSNHIAFPIYLSTYREKEEGEKEVERSQCNQASALWKRPKNEISAADYTEFFHSLAHDAGEPLLTVHTKAEGILEYTSLFFIPEKAPFDLFQADARSGLKLYVRRVFISDDNRLFLPVYLRFVRGVIDSEDLPLNVSREILQENKVVQKIRDASVKKLLSEFANLAKTDPEKYTRFIEQYNRPLKEGLYSDYANRAELQKLIRFRSSAVEGWTSLEEYRSRMLEDQKSIYYISGAKEDQLRNSPLLEAYKKKGIEVLLLSDEIDEFIAPQLGPFDGLEIKGVNRSDSVDDLRGDSGEQDSKRDESFADLVAKCKEILQDRVKDVVLSVRLTESPACVVSDQNDPSGQLQQMMKAMGQDMPEVKPILELNPDHVVIRNLNEKFGQPAEKAEVETYCHLLLDQALLAAGLGISDPLATARRLSSILEKTVGV